MPSRQTMADFMAEQKAIEDAPAGLARHGLSTVHDSPPGAAAIPQPPAGPGDGPLDPAEQHDLTTCEAALDNLRMAFWAAGKALQVIRDGCLYRDGYDTFEAYVEDRWHMRRAYADKLIRAWPLAERLDPIGSKDLNEAQVRELLPVEQQHGQDAAALAYQTVVEVDGKRVTAAVLHDVAAILTVGPFDSAKAVRQIRAYLAGQLRPPARPARPVDPVRMFAQSDKLTIADLEQMTDGDLDVVRVAAPENITSTAARLHAQLTRLEHGSSG